MIFESHIHVRLGRIGHCGHAELKHDSRSTPKRKDACMVQLHPAWRLPHSQSLVARTEDRFVMVRGWRSRFWGINGYSPAQQKTGMSACLRQVDVNRRHGQELKACKRTGSARVLARFLSQERREPLQCPPLYTRVDSCRMRPSAMKRDHSTRRTALRPRGFVCFFFGTAWHKPLEEVEVRRQAAFV